MLSRRIQKPRRQWIVQGSRTNWLDMNFAIRKSELQIFVEVLAGNALSKAVEDITFVRRRIELKLFQTLQKHSET